MTPRDPATPEETARRFVAERGPRLHALALRLCADPADAEELAFRALERALPRLSGLRPGSDVDAWLRTVLLNLWRNDRRAARRRSAAEPPPGAAPDPAALPDPAPAVKLTACGPSSMDYAVRLWTATADYWDVYFGLLERGKRALDAAGIQVPFQQVDVHLKAED